MLCTEEGGAVAHVGLHVAPPMAGDRFGAREIALAGGAEEIE